MAVALLLRARESILLRQSKSCIKLQSQGISLIECSEYLQVGIKVVGEYFQTST